jgi:hypothetical protein
MSDPISLMAVALRDAHYSTNRLSFAGREVLWFEGDTVFGFVIGYETAADLIHTWSEDLAAILTRHALILRRGGQKAWNTYAFFVTANVASSSEVLAMSVIEENLAGTRKIARGGVSTDLTARAVLLPLLPIQQAPQLEAVETIGAIRMRATEVGDGAFKAFLSNSSPAQILSAFEEEQ